VLPPEGWFPDPERPGKLRWWDGAQWTEHRTDDPSFQQADQPAYSGPTKTSGWAIAALVLGVLGGVLPAILCGVIAKDRIRKAGGRLTGDAMATVGIVFGSIWAVVFIAAFVLPELEVKDNADDFNGSQRAVATVVDRVERTFAEDRGDEACADLFTTAFARKVARGAGRTCSDVVDDAIEPGQTQAPIRIDGIVIRGDTARVRLREGSEKQRWKLRRVGRSWLVDAIAAAPSG
jgi:hypothetical protein